MKRIVIICTLLWTLYACHYSCFNCTGQLYTSCISCPASTLTVVEDPNSIPQVYWSSVYPTGTCVDTLGGKANPLGIVLFIVLSAILLIGGSKEGLYLYLTIQTWGLYNLVEIAWVNPVGYLLQGLQYFMIWNVLGSGYKSVDYTLLTNKYYRMSLYLKQTGLAQNIALIAAFTLLAMVLLIIICIIAIRRKKQARIKEEVVFQISGRSEQMQEQKKETCWEWFSDKILIQIAKFLLVVLFLMAQETSLVLVVSLVFNLNAATVIVSIIYLHILVFVMSYAYYYRVEYFREKKVMYINFGKKVVLPIMVVVPIKYHFLLFLFAAAALVIEIIIDWYNGFYKKFSRLAFYKVLEMLIFILLVTCYIVEQTGMRYSPTKAASIAVTFTIAFYIFIFVGVEFPIAIKERFFSKKKQKMEQVQNPIEDTINQINEKQLPLQTFEVVEMSKQSQDSQQEEQQPKKEPEQPQQDDKKTKDGSINGNGSLNGKQSIPKQTAPEPKPAPPPKKRRRQILDPQLRMRYGI